MQSLESIIHEANAVRGMANSDPKFDVAAAVMNLSDLIVSLACHVRDIYGAQESSKPHETPVE